MDRGLRPSRGPEGYGHFHRRSPSHAEARRQYGGQPHSPQEEFYHRRPSPRRHYKDRGLSSHPDGGFEGKRLPSFPSRSRSPRSPLRVQRERLPADAQRATHFSQGASCWSGEDPGRGGGEFCPRDGNKDHRFSSGDGHGRALPHHRRSPALKGQQREWDDHSHRGFRHEEQALGSDTCAPHPHGRPSPGGFRHSGPLIIDHGHGVCEDRGPRAQPRGSSSQDGPRGSPARWDAERSPQDGFYRRKDPAWDGMAHHARHHWPPPGSRSSQRRTDWQHKNPPPAQQRHQSRQQRPGSQSHPAEFHGPEEEEHLHDPRRSGPESLERDRTREDLDPRMPRLWLQNLQNVNNPPTEDEETLTIKVDTSRPVTLESSARFSTDRQLSQDLVNVGRQRLDFLPMLQHSGTFRETSVHVGTFAEEIISLVHHVKEVYFRGDAITLNQRFSAPRHESVPEEEKEELTLNQRFSTTNRAFHLDLDLDLDEDPPLLEPPELLQKPQRGPGDLRHNLERRRQERLEGVKVTIAGSSSAPQPLLSSLSGWISTFRNQDSLTEEDSRPKSSTAHLRGFFRPNGPGRNYRKGFCPKRQNHHGGPAGPGW